MANIPISCFPGYGPAAYREAIGTFRFLRSLKVREYEGSNAGFGRNCERSPGRLAENSCLFIRWLKHKLQVIFCRYAENYPYCCFAMISFFMKHSLLLLLVLSIISSSACKRVSRQFKPDHAEIRYAGRIDMAKPEEPVLISSASFVELSFSGDSCQVLLKNLNAGEHNYVSLELDGEYWGRVRLESDSMMFHTIVASTAAEEHSLKIYKATEAQNGNIAFGGVKTMGLNALPEAPRRKIEFIGNSITSGMGIDWKEIPCDSGVWYDQHNAYWAYGPRVARELDASFMLSSVSGIGMYRNWNSLSPVMPDVYKNMYLNTDDSRPWTFSAFTPDLVSICLGTNDFSEGDGINERLPFDSTRFVDSYIDFVSTVYSKYPDAQLCLLTSPMVSGENGQLFVSCLMAVQQYFSEQRPDRKKIAVYDFESFSPQGCGHHPDKEDHQQMAANLVPFYREVMGW